MEAVIEIQVQAPASVSLDTLATMQQDQEKNYPTRRNRVFVEGVLSVDPDTPVATGNRVQLGYDFVSTDERYIVSARLDAFSFSRLAPYERWSSFRDEAHRWWTIYRTIVKPLVITRVAVRYINRFTLPLPVDDLKDYLRTVPEISPVLLQGLSGYFMQLQIPQSDIGAMLNLNQAMPPLEPSAPSSATVILDIDLFSADEVPQSDNEIWDYLEILRGRKNEIFLGSITERTEALFGRRR